MNQVLEFRDIEAVASLRGEWQRLLERTPHASFIQSWDWLAARWEHVAPETKLRLLAVKNDQGEVTGILPFIIQPEKTRMGTLRALTWPNDRWSSFYGPIGAEPARILQEGLIYLQSTRRDYDIVDLHSLPALSVTSSEELEDCERVFVSPAHQPHSCVPEFSEVAMIDLIGNWEEYWESRGRNRSRRRNMERCNRRLEQSGQVTYLRYRPLGQQAGDSDARWDLYDACEKLASRSWQAGLTDGNTLSHDHVRGLLRNVHQKAAASGALDMNLLYVDERLVAFGYGYHYRGYIDLLRIGFDPEFSKFGPGNCLWTRMIADSFERGDRVFDLGPTCLDYKRFWLTRIESSFRLMRYALWPRAQAIRIARWIRDLWPQRQDDSDHRDKESVQETQLPA